MDDLELVSYLRSLRRHAGFSQRDLAELIGYPSHDQISRHERGDNLPSLLIALSYEAVFGLSIAELFPGVYTAVQDGIEQRLAAYHAKLLESSGKGRKAPATARQLEWFTGRNGPQSRQFGDAPREV
jgi:transcriptional regulator with XRE-family HTH domain